MCTSAFQTIVEGQSLATKTSLFKTDAPWHFNLVPTAFSTFPVRCGLLRHTQVASFAWPVDCEWLHTKTKTYTWSRNWNGIFTLNKILNLLFVRSCFYPRHVESIHRHQPVPASKIHRSYDLRTPFHDFRFLHDRRRTGKLFHSTETWRRWQLTFKTSSAESKEPAVVYVRTFELLPPPSKFSKPNSRLEYLNQR